MEDNLLRFLITASQHFFPNTKIKIWLFGSRARGDFKERSDYDLAFDLPEGAHAEFFTYINENAPTLCGIDAVNLKQAGKAFKRVIETEGKIIYES